MTGSEILAAALRLLAVRDLSEAELAGRLRQKGFPEAGIDAVLERCRELGYVDDGRFARERAISLMGSGRAVGRRLLADLKKRGVPEAVALAAAEEAGAGFDHEALLAGILERRFPRFSFREADDREKRRVVGYFQRRGFSLETLLSYFTKER